MEHESVVMKHTVWLRLRHRHATTTLHAENPMLEITAPIYTYIFISSGTCL